MATFVYYRSERGFIPFGADEAGMLADHWESLSLGNKLAVMEDMKELHSRKRDDLNRATLRRKRDLHHFAWYVTIFGNRHVFKVPSFLNWLASVFAQPPASVYESWRNL